MRMGSGDVSLQWLTKQQKRARGIRCPFWRRRVADGLEPLLATARFLAARHKSLPVLAPTQASSAPKQHGLPLTTLMEIIRTDLVERQYYVTGRLTPSVYADDCFFDGPDPDMPVRSLQRYSDALRGLFDPKSSALELLSLHSNDSGSFVARWRLCGALQLPWRPKFKSFTGCTLYELNPEGLVCRHTETWSIDALDAFVSMFWPTFGAPSAPPAHELKEALESGVMNSELQRFVVRQPLRCAKHMDMPMLAPKLGVKRGILEEAHEAHDRSPHADEAHC